MKLADLYLASKVNVRPSTRRNYESLITLYLKPYFGTWLARQISGSDIERFRNELAEGYPSPILDAFTIRLRDAKPALSHARAKRQAARRRKPGVRTINKCLTLLVMIFGYGCRHRWIDFNPAEHVEKLRQQSVDDSHSIDGNVLTPIEIRGLIAAAESAKQDRNGSLKSNNYRLLIKMAIFTGMRSGEVRGLQWGDIDWVSREIHVRRSWKECQFHPPKTKTSNRSIELPAELLSELRTWKLASPKGDFDLIFPNLAGNPMSNANLLQRGFYPALRRAGLRRIRFHDLRHTFASLLIASGEDIVRISRLLGHSSPKVTLDVYAHMLPNDHYGSAERLSALILDEPTKNAQGI